jgi:hypothetical protein
MHTGRLFHTPGTYRRNGIDAFSYAVQTSDGREVWEVGELFVPEQL